ncbi:thiopurine S-methyltransferase [Accumulibacter sp.]|uniref:thiopurine S-methyltransferase n=1 Tax=Accumulibacter sp. TaxID=2053492 RepID=UPI00262028A3|nr:thiopurine S-methyltransferase [Accumulibacter sp.]
MDADFWHGKWAQNEIGFHESEANPLLVRHFPALGLGDGARVFVPLCGKTLDIHWLLDKGHPVVGVELSPLAVEQLFSELGAEPDITSCGRLQRYSVPDLDVYLGDFFALTAELLGLVDATYDRAALVALPEPMRGRYAAHLRAITACAPQLLICFEYEPHLMPGPPFPIFADEVARHYRDHYTVSLLSSEEIPGGFKGKIPAKESVWQLGRGRGS